MRDNSGLDDIKADDLGLAGPVGQKDVDGDERIFVEDVEDTKSVTLILRSGTGHAVDEFEHAIEDSLGVVCTTLEDGKVLPGGGAPETELSLQLREFVSSIGDHKQLAVETFAEVLDIIPCTLVENAGLDPIDSLVDLYSRHDGGEFVAGLDAYTDEVINIEEEGVVEPFRVKTQAIKSAIEATVVVLHIDDIIVTGDLSGGQAGDDDDDGGVPNGMGGGMDGMGGIGGMDGAM